MAEYEVPEKAKSRHERVVGLIIAVIAVVLAFISSAAKESHNQEILAHIDATDQFSFYQAKRARAQALQLSADSFALHGDQLSPANALRATQFAAAYAKEQARLGSEGAEIQAVGKGLMEKSERLAHKARILDVGEIALQISIVLCSITILTEQRLFVIMGVITGAIGLAIGLFGVAVG